MKNISFLTPISLRRYGGGEKWIINVGNLLYKKGYKVNVYSLSYAPDARVKEDYIKEIIKFEYFEIPYKKDKITPLQMREIPDLNSDTLYVMGVYYYFLKQVVKINIPKIWGFHNPILMNPQSYFQKRILEKILPKFDYIHILNEKQRKLIKNNNVYLLENTYLEELPEKMNKYDKFTVIFFGRHEKNKGIYTVKYIAENLPNDIDLIIAGTGSESYILNNIRRENVKILGFLDDNKLSEIISKSHLVLFPSDIESSSLVSVESLAHCTPLIYKPIPENYMLQKIQFNIQANNDIDFLKGIMLKYNEYIKDKEKYISECYKLPQYLISKEEYINKFIEYFLS